MGGVEGDGEQADAGGGVQSREDHFEGGLPDYDPEEQPQQGLPQ